jgi:hypothetical protein
MTATRDAANPVHLVIGLTGLEFDTGDVKLFRDQVFRIPMPAAFGAEHMELMRRDCEMLAEIARENPDGLVTLHNAALANDFATANRVAAEIGLREERFYAEGGGFWGWIAVAAVIILVAAATTSDSPSPPQPPPDPPPPTDPPHDAGADG